MAGIDERTGRRRRARALIRAGGGRMAASAAPLRPLGGRMMLEFNRVHTVVIEHAFTIAERGGGNLELLGEIATKLPDLRFADFWHGYLRYLRAEVDLSRQRPVT
jgi:hypothetical protein